MIRYCLPSDHTRVPERVRVRRKGSADGGRPRERVANARFDARDFGGLLHDGGVELEGVQLLARGTRRGRA